MTQHSGPAHRNVSPWRTLYRGRLYVLVSTGIFSGLALFLSWRTPPVYEASTTIRIDAYGDPGLIPMMGASLTPVTGILDDEMEIIRSRSLAEAVLERAVAGHRILTLLESTPPDRGAEKLLKALTVTPIRKSRLVELRLKAPDADEARDLVNLYAAIYQERDRLQARTEIRQTKQFLGEQVGVVKRRLEMTEEALREYQATERVADLTEGTQATVSKLAEFRAEHSLARAERQTSEDRLRFLRDRLAEREATLVSDVQQISPGLVENLRLELSQLESARSRLLTQGLSPTHEKMGEVEDRIERLRGNLKEAAGRVSASTRMTGDPLGDSQALSREVQLLEAEVLTLRSKEEALGQILGGYDQDLQKIPTIALQLARLERAKHVDEKILGMLMETLEETRIQEAGLLGQVAIIDPAKIPIEPVAPRPVRDTGLGLLAGLMIGIAAAFVRMRLMDRLESVDDVEAAIGTPPIGVLPRIKYGGRGQPRSPLLLGKKGWLQELESYRRLATNLDFAEEEGALRVIAVASALPREGKSLTAANLGHVLTLKGKRVLLVDADFRRPRLHTLFGIPNTHGLSDLLTHPQPGRNLAVPTPCQRLELLPAGEQPPNPGELLGSRRMQDLLTELNGSYDVILVDTPPLLAVGDAIELGKHADGMLLVVRTGATPSNALREAYDLLQRPKLRVLGVVVNDFVPRDRAGYTYGYGEYYAGLSGSYPHDDTRAA